MRSMNVFSVLCLPRLLQSTSKSINHSLYFSSKSTLTARRLPYPQDSRLIRRPFTSTAYEMADMEIELTAPNGVKYTQPLGLFINNEWVKPKKGEKITSINPSYAIFLF